MALGVPPHINWSVVMDLDEALAALQFTAFEGKTLTLHEAAALYTLWREARGARQFGRPIQMKDQSGEHVEPATTR